MLEKDFTLREQALALKELGFDEPCFTFYPKEGKMGFDGKYHSIKEGYKNSTVNAIWIKRYKKDFECVAAPTYSQAFKFFREKYGLHQYIKQYCGESFYFHIEDMVHPRRFDEYTVEMLRSFNESTSQEEAELECLIKLIEIVKQKKD
jgi:hypothetical protein